MVGEVTSVNIAVCGRFHYHNYVRYLAEADVLCRIYFSYKIIASNQLRIDPIHCVNVWPKEYLVQAHGRLLGDRFTGLHAAYGKVWSLGALASWVPASILHVMAHGYGLSLISRARADGSRILAEAVNTHPANRREILAREMDHWEIRGVRRGTSAVEQRLVTELHEADVVLVPTDTVHRSLVERGIDAGKIHKLPYAANLSRFFPRQPSEPKRQCDGPLKVICVGAIGLRKGQLYLLEACRRMEKGAIELTLVGTISSQVWALMRRYEGLYRHIERVPNGELRSLLLQHDVFVLPSLEEGLAVAVCEAMACGLPVVATRESGAEEIVVEGMSGYFVAAGSSDELARRLVFLSENRELLGPVGIRAAETTQRNVNWQAYARQLMVIYERVMVNSDVVFGSA
jgi:glycosyltransferase involved in cell wall biosynthesis